MESAVAFVDSVSNLFSVVIKLCLAATVPLAIAAFINWMMRDSVTTQVGSQETRWEADRKESAYLECLKLLWQSRCQYYKGSKLNHGDFLGRMQTLQYIEPWVVVAGNRSSPESREAMEEAVRGLKEKIDLVRRETPEDSGDCDPADKNKKIFVVEGHGVCEQIDRALDTVIECCKRELRQNVGPSFLVK